MKTIEIKASLRKQTGKKKSTEARNNLLVPCVMYGGEEIIHFEAHENEFRHLVYTHHIYVVNLNVEGKTYQAILKEIQFHPVTDRLQHIDFVQVFNDKTVVVSLPVTIIGSSVGVKAGGKARQKKRYLKVKGLIKDMPETLDVDITDLNIGNVIKVNQVKYDNLEMLDAPYSLVVGVYASRVSKSMEAGEGAATPEAAAAPAAAAATKA